jgi:hypothetical protein
MTERAQKEQDALDNLSSAMKAWSVAWKESEAANRRLDRAQAAKDDAMRRLHDVVREE